MKKLFAIFTIAVLTAVCFTGCGKNAETNKLEYSDVTGLWGTEEGDMTVYFNDNKTGNVSSVTGDTVDNTEFTYVINYDEKSEESSIIISTEDDYSETYTAELDNNILTLTLYDTETGSDAVTKLIKGQKLVMPEDSTDSDENKIETTTSVAVPAEEKAEDTTAEATTSTSHKSINEDNPSSVVAYTSSDKSTTFEANEPHNDHAQIASTTKAYATFVGTFNITKINGTHIEMRRVIAGDKLSEQIYCFDLDEIKGSEDKHYKVGDNIRLNYDADDSSLQNDGTIKLTVYTII